MSSHGSYGLWSAYLAGGDVVVADGYSGHQGGNSIENIWLEFWFEKRLEITFWFCNMSQLPIFELFIIVGNLKPKLKCFSS